MMSEGEDINLLQEEEEIKFAEDPQFEEAPDDPDDIEFKEEEKVKDLSIKTEEDGEIIDTSEGQKSRPKNRSKDDATNFYCCNLCGYKDCEKYRVRYHLNRIHKELKDHCKILRVGCKECEKGNNCCVDQKQEKKMKNKLKCLKESCNFSAGSKLRLRRHIERLHKELLDYACNNCDFRTYNERSLFQHTLMTHNDAQDFSYGCHECGKSFKVKRSLDNHLENIHGSRKRFYCSDCEFPSYSKYSVKDHQKNVHPENENCKILKIGCEDCENGDNSCVDEDKRRKRETHQNVMKMEVDSNGEYICNLCQTKTKTKANAQAHIEMVHENKFNFKCSECNYQSYYGPSIKRHQMRKHVNILCQIIKVICEACNKGEDHKDCKRIKDPENISHVSFNKGNEFKCSLCDYQTDKYQNVAFHLQSLKHQGVEGKVLTLGCQDCEEGKDHPCFQKGKQAEKSLKSNFACELCGLKSNSQVAKAGVNIYFQFLVINLIIIINKILTIIQYIISNNLLKINNPIVELPVYRMGTDKIYYLTNPFPNLS